MIKVKELIYLSKAISDNLYGFDKDDLEVVFKVSDEDLQDINEQFFYGNNPNPNSEKVSKADEVDAKIGNIRFKFVRK